VVAKKTRAPLIASFACNFQALRWPMRLKWEAGSKCQNYKREKSLKSGLGKLGVLRNLLKLVI
jgi:hypothetical protein